MPVPDYSPSNVAPWRPQPEIVIEEFPSDPRTSHNVQEICRQILKPYGTSSAPNIQVVSNPLNSKTAVVRVHVRNTGGAFYDLSPNPACTTSSTAIAEGLTYVNVAQGGGQRFGVMAAPL